MRISLKLVLFCVTACAVMLGIGVYVREQTYTRHRVAQAFFERHGARVVVGDACPPDFVYGIDGDDRRHGLPDTSVTPNEIERLVGFRFTWKPVREVSFCTPYFRSSLIDRRLTFTPSMFEEIPRLAPELELLNIPPPTKNGVKIKIERTESLFRPISQLSNLRVLSIDGWSVNDVDVEILMKLRRLQVLHLENHCITDRALSIFEESESLRFVGLPDANLPQAAINRLRARRPKLVLNINGQWYGDHTALYAYRDTKPPPMQEY